MLRPGDRRPVVLKVVDPRRCRDQDLERLRREYETAQSLEVNAVVRPIALETYQGMPALVLEDFGGDPLDALLGSPLSVGTFLPLALATTRAVCELHRQGFIHKDLKPEAVLVHPGTGEVKLVDLGIATRLSPESQPERPPQLVEGSLPYLSPEQTGWMNRAVDSRSDLYALGVTFYRMLTGRLPFEARDALQWIHCHLAQLPAPPSRLAPDVPEALDLLVARLLAKVAEDRYQTARGLAHDLARCLDEWRSSGRVATFSLGERDVPDRLPVSQRHHRRDEQVAALAAAPAATFAARTEQLDLLSVVKASQTLSGEFEPERLIGTLLQIVLEQGGARKGCLVLCHEGALSVEAVAVLDEKGVSTRSVPSLPVERASFLPISVAQRAQRTRGPVIIDDAATDPGSFASDPYFSLVWTRSVLGLPILRQESLVGLLLLENDLVAGAFTPDRLAALSLLAAQAAISIENARFVLEIRREQERCARLAGELERELVERKAIEDERLQRVEMAALSADVGMAVTQGDTLPATLQRCAEAIVRRLGAAFARIWCHGPEQGVLVLQASAGAYARLDGPRARVRVGELEIGKIAEERRPHVTNDVPGDPLIDREWARREGMLSFAGHPLLAGGKLVGVMVLFARRPLGEVTLKGLASIADAVAVAIQRGFAEAARASLEEQFREAQKLESVGRLAGGVAHDFNNLLTIILSGTEILKEELGAGAPLDPAVLEGIDAAGLRARDLTRQLLAFARRQVIAPVPVDLDALVRDQEKLLRRVLGEDVELVTNLQPALWSARCDPGQMEQVILNLAVNARDAMPGGGTLTIQTSNVVVEGRSGTRFSGVTPGPYVLLEIRDSGVGMSPEVKARLFEPFFTTKPAGKGTGLGLATVHGIVEQSGGVIRVESQPGRGTSFELLFPRTLERAVPAAASLPPPTTKGHETVLLVEDDPEVRAVTARTLRAAGYQVLSAGGAQEALAIGKEPCALQLLLTDVVMPGLDGRELAEKLRRRHPGVRVLYVSGHAEEVIVNRGVLGPGAELLAKPFTPSSLLARVRAVLDAR